MTVSRWDIDAYADAAKFLRDVERAEEHEADDGWAPDPVDPADVLTDDELRQYYRSRRRT